MPIVHVVPENMPADVDQLYRDLQKSGTGLAKLAVVAECANAEAAVKALRNAGYDNTADKAEGIMDTEAFAVRKVQAAEALVEKAKADALALAARKEQKAKAKAEADAEAAKVATVAAKTGAGAGGK